MVDLAEIQAAYYMVAATGVLIAAVFYILNLREQRRNMRLTLETRRINLIESMSSHLLTSEGMRDFYEILSYEWKDYENFMRKYGPRSNVEATIKRHRTWLSYNNLGAMLRKGMVEAEDLYDLDAAVGVIQMWKKYGSYIKESARGPINGTDYCSDFEYLAGEMMKEKLKRDPSYKISGQ